MKMFEGKKVKVLLAQAGAGKALDNATLIPTPNGLVELKDIKVGDYAFSAKGKPTKVLGVYPQGEKEAYKVTFSDGRSIVCCLEHLWSVYTRGKNQWKYSVEELGTLLNKGIRGKDKRENRKYGQPKFYIPASPVCEYETKELPINPYVLGSFLGNGCLTLPYLTLSSKDEWQVNKVASILGYEVKRNNANYSWTFYKNGKIIKTSEIFPPELCSYAKDKYIPSEYIFADVEQRRSLLCGLFDTDGSVDASERCHVSYTTSSKRLCKDIQTVLLSLGIVSTVREDKRKDNICYELRMNCSKENKKLLFSLPRKKDRIIYNTKISKRDYSKVAIRSVEKLNKKVEMTCLYVEDAEHLFLAGDFIVTHNTHRLIQEISKELEHRRPEEIAFVTFTRKGAEEGLRRVCNKLMLTPDDLPYFKTLHSLTFHALDFKANQMFSRLDEKKFNKEYGYNLNRNDVSTGKVQPTKDTSYLDYYDLERSGALTSKQIVEEDIEIAYYHQLVQKYEEYKSAQCLVDFFDCLIKYVQVGDSLPCKVVMIDECQDITALQWKVIEKAFANAEEIYLVGDENQCIYRYNGARPDFLINFAKQFEVEYLPKSHRLPRQVYNLAKAITDFIQEKTDKPFLFKEGNIEGNVTQLNNLDRLPNFIMEPENKKTTDWYLLVRNNCYIEKVQRILEENLIPYWTTDGFFMGGNIMTRLKDYEGFRLEGYKSEEKREEFKRKFGIEDFSVPFTDTNLFSTEKKWVYEAYIEKYGLEKLKEMCKWTPQILISTIHQVKGGEADNVALLLDSTRRTVLNTYDNIDDELRVLYVGVTRAKKNLFLVDSTSKYGYNQIIEVIKDENGLQW